MSELKTFLQHKLQVIESAETSKSYKIHINNEISYKVQSQKCKSFSKIRSVLYVNQILYVNQNLLFM